MTNRTCCTRRCSTFPQRFGVSRVAVGGTRLFPRRWEKPRRSCCEASATTPYWHGVFGGLYAPHLRIAPWRSLVEAEAIADGLSHKSRHYADATELDFDADGHDEIYLTSDRYAVLFQPHDGGTICDIDCRSSNATLINSLMRRPESYHAKLRDHQTQNAQGVQSIHEQTRTKEAGLERWLNYDRWPQNCFRLLLFGRDKNYQDCASVRLNEDAGACGRSLFDRAKRRRSWFRSRRRRAPIGSRRSIFHSRRRRTGSRSSVTSS